MPIADHGYNWKDDKQEDGHFMRKAKASLTRRITPATGNCKQRYPMHASESLWTGWGSQSGSSERFD